MSRFKDLVSRVMTLEQHNQEVQGKIAELRTRVCDVEGAFRAIARMHLKDYVEEVDPYSLMTTKYRHYLIELVEEKPKKKAIKHRPKTPNCN